MAHAKVDDNTKSAIVFSTPSHFPLSDAMREKSNKACTNQHNKAILEAENYLG